MRSIVPALLLIGAVSAAGAQSPQSVAARIEATGGTAASALDQPANLSVEDVTLEQALIRLYEGSGVPVSFSPSALPRTLRVSCRCRDVTVAEALDSLLAGTPLRYREIEGHVLVFDSSLRPTLTPQPPPARYALAQPVVVFRSSPPAVAGTISGQVLDATTQEPVADVTVALVGTSHSTRTRADGRFVIADVPSGAQRVRVNLIGYATQEQSVTVADGETVDVTFHMQSEALRLEGVVTSEGGQPISGASVTIVGTSLGALTGADGRYTITDVPAGTHDVNANLIGYAELTRQVVVAAGDSAIADFHLSAEAILLEGIVAVGYGTQTRREVTGSVASIQSREISRIVTANPVDAIKGRLPGVDIRSQSFEPGAAATVRIRGARSISASNAPLIVVDGVPISGDLRDIDSEDIASIEVLKDAAASAVYGSRAANGVLLITTKQGSLGRTRFEYSGTYGVSEIVRRPDLMNGVEFANFAREAQRAAGGPACADYLSDPTECDSVALDALMRENLAAGVSTDWQDEVLRAGQLQNHQVAVSGGNEDMRFRASIGFLNQTGITITQGYTSKTGNLSVGHDFGRLNVQGSVIAGQSVREAGRGAGVWDEALFNSPLGRVRDAEGNLIFLPTEDGLRVNPVSDALNNVHDITRTHVLGTISGALDLMDGVTLNVNFGPEYTEVEDGYFVGTFTRENQGQTLPFAGVDNSRSVNYTLSTYLGIDRQVGDRHRLQTTLLYEIAHSDWTNAVSSARELPYSHQLWHDLDTGQDHEVESERSESSLESFMARLNYTLDDRYTLSLVGRVDGSSVLAEGHKYAFFPAAAFAWQIGSESFMDAVPVSDLKLRAGYGRKGNSAINPYQTLGTLSDLWYSFGDPIIGYQPGSIPNPDLEWETTDEFNLGLDFGLLNNRITGSFDAYLQQTHDLLLPRAVPYHSGYSTVLQNVGETKNKGFELALYTVNLDDWHGLNWSTDLTFSTNNNEIVALAGGLTEDIGSGRWVGQPINVNFDYDFIGIWQTSEAEEAAAMGFAPGDVKVADLNGDGEITGEDRTFIGNHVDFPDWQGSINNRFRYRNFDLSVLVTARWGYTVDNGFIAGYANLGGRFNNLDVNYWTPENPSNAFPRPNANNLGNFYGSRAYQDGSHVRIRDITLGYVVPQSMLAPLGVDRARVYVRAQDPFLFTNDEFLGWDPEAGFSSGDGNFTESQIDSGSPAYRSFLFGVDVSF